MNDYQEFLKAIDDCYLVTDSAGITAMYTPIERVKRGDEITEGWKPWPVVSSVEIDGEYARMIFGPNHVGQWHPFGTRVPVLLAPLECDRERP